MYNILLILFIITNTIPRWVHGMTIWQGRSCYYVGQAVSLVFLIAALYTKPRKVTRLNRGILRVTAWFIVSNLLDELFFNPVLFEWNEGVFALFIIISELIIYIRESKRRA